MIGWDVFWIDQSHQPDSNDDTQAACVIIFSFFTNVFTHYTIKQVMINFMDHVLVMILMTINMIDDIYA